MKTLFLVRHAKSSWNDASHSDHDRPLNARGFADAPVIGQRLAARGVEPDLMLSSSALRALTTAQIIAGQLGQAPEAVVVDDRIYGAHERTLLDLVKALDDSVGTVMLFGHNPTMTQLAHRFAPSIVDMPTCAVAAFGFDTAAWARIDAVGAQLLSFDMPSDH
jgi:phosphohistidine phosphatase